MKRYRCTVCGYECDEPVPDNARFAAVPPRCSKRSGSEPHLVFPPVVGKLAAKLQKMNISSAVFKCSSQKISQIPSDGLPEFAFIGRSNVGKSSLVNMLTGRPSLAKVSGTPGKTRLINHFLVNDRWYLVDLPGYGYARVSKGERQGFSSLITGYIKNSKALHFLFVLVDSRLEPQKIDLEFIDLLGRSGIPFGIVFTKTDKLTPGKAKTNIEAYGRKLLETWEELPPVFITSSEKKQGRDEILDFIQGCLDAPGEGR